ncbi:MAG: hypothetical protein ACI4PF_03505 [Christensenellales bacterium]
MASVRIIKGSLRNVVDEIQFEKLYKPNGWRLDEENASNDETEEVKAVKTLNTISEIKNFVNMKKKKPKKFDDKLFKEDIERDT